MDPDQVKKLLKRGAIVGGFFLLAVLFYGLGWTGVLWAYALLVSAMMVLAILLQSGRGGGLASLGGLGGDSLFGTRSSTPIAKATYVLGALLLFLCMLISRAGQKGVGMPAGVIGLPARPAPVQPLEPPAVDTGAQPQPPEQPQQPEGDAAEGAGSVLPDSPEP